MSDGAEEAIQVLAEYMAQTYEVECGFCPKQQNNTCCISECTVGDATAARILWARNGIKRIRRAEGQDVDYDETTGVRAW